MVKRRTLSLCLLLIVLVVLLSPVPETAATWQQVSEADIDAFFAQGEQGVTITSLCGHSLLFAEAQESLYHRALVRRYLEWDMMGRPRPTALEGQAANRSRGEPEPSIVYSDPAYDRYTITSSPYVQVNCSKASQSGYPCIHLYQTAALPGPFAQAMTEAIALGGTGHGNASTFTGYEGTPLLVAHESNTAELMRGKWFWPMTCLTGIELAPWLAETVGANSLAYDRLFWIVVNSMDEHVFFDTHFTFPGELYQGATGLEAYQATLEAYYEALETINLSARPYLLNNAEGCHYYYAVDRSLTTIVYQIYLPVMINTAVVGVN